MFNQRLRFTLLSTLKYHITSHVDYIKLNIKLHFLIFVDFNFYLFGLMIIALPSISLGENY